MKKSDGHNNGWTDGRDRECLSRYVTVSRAAQIAGVTTQAVRRAIKENRIKATKLGAHTRLIRTDRLDKYIFGMAK